MISSYEHSQPGYRNESKMAYKSVDVALISKFSTKHYEWRRQNFIWMTFSVASQLSDDFDKRSKEEKAKGKNAAFLTSGTRLKVPLWTEAREDKGTFIFS